jgi:glucosamine--fructose-6-phosphate aminotransferase (isomerizing)
MCGIVGAIASRDVVPLLTAGLKRLEYRGYDSAGIAVLNGGIRRVRRVGRVSEMENAAQAEGLKGIVGIAHTRWATHGGVTEPNAHPHVSANQIAVVHNGIIENHEEQRARLQAAGYTFESQTDTEGRGAPDPPLLQAIARPVRGHAKGGRGPARRLCARRGFARAARRDGRGAHGCPLVVGLGDGENYLASDFSALVSETPARDLPRGRRRRGAHPRRRRGGGPQRTQGRAQGPPLGALRRRGRPGGRTSTTCRRRSTSSRERSPTPSRP